MSLLFWIIFFVAIISLIIIDLKVTKKRGQEALTFGESMTWTLIWIITALLFNFVVYYVYESSESVLNGKEAALLFFTGYLVEKSLSLDNIFVIALIFSAFRVPHHLQHRVLLWGVFGAILMRFLMIFLGITLITSFSFVTLLFGLLLIATALKMLFMKEHHVHPEDHWVVLLAKKIVPLTPKYHGEAFFIKENGKLFMTPLFLALVVIETTDLLFAIDSIPAIFAITTDPFIVFTSNIFAILGLRSLYFVLVTAINRFYYLRFSLIFLLAFVGVKMLLAHVYPINTLVSLFIILSVLFLGVLASVISKELKMPEWAIVIYEQFREVAIATGKDIKRIAILIAGLTLLLLGLVMLILPGPGLLFIGVGLILLAKEFIIARRLLKKLKKTKKDVFNLFDKKEDE
jgi:tellurite resistance protein TerC